MNSRLEMETRIVERYTRMADASGRMLAAARRDDWDTVSATEMECTRLIAELSSMGDLVPTDPHLRDQKLAMMKRVLADDAEIRVLTQPWMKKLDALLRNSDTVARLDRAYGSSGPRP
jgi:flagellar protein FliT